MRLDPEILDGPPETGARILALARLADAEEALGRTADPKDREASRALADATVRLAAALAALAPGLAGAVPPALRTELDPIARAAATARDPDVLATWLAAARGELPGPYRGALDWLADRVERRARRAREEVLADAAPRLRKLLPRLAAALTARRGAIPRPDAPATFAALHAGALRAQTRALREALAAVAGPGDAVALEGALLEARAEEVRRGEALAGLRPGLLALLNVAEQRGAAAERELALHLRTTATPVTDAAYAVVAALEASGADAAEEEGKVVPAAAPERRFLVTAIPSEGQGGDVEALEQGWLPGDARESVGVTRSALGEQWFRARAPARGRPGRPRPGGTSTSTWIVRSCSPWRRRGTSRHRRSGSSPCSSARCRRSAGISTRRSPAGLRGEPPSAREVSRDGGLRPLTLALSPAGGGVAAGVGTGASPVLPLSQ